VQRVEETGHDLVVVADDPEEHGWAGVSKQLIRTCPVPVLLQAPTRSRQCRIVAAVDADASDADHARLNEEILRVTAAFAGSEAEVVLVHAWQLPFESALRDGLFVRLPEQDFYELKTAVLAERSEELGALVPDHFAPGVDVTACLVEGAPKDVVPTEVRRSRATLLVLGTVARTGLRGYLLGNTAEDILDRVTCSVVTVKPPVDQPV
jgi:nucleotide-binding universal stress UspA family protein